MESKPDIDGAVAEIAAILREANSGLVRQYIAVGTIIEREVRRQEVAPAVVCSMMRTRLDRLISRTTLQAAHKAAVLFKGHLREAVIACGMPWFRVQALCHSRYDDADRKEMVSEYRRGKIGACEISTPGIDNAKRRYHVSGRKTRWSLPVQLDQAVNIELKKDGTVNWEGIDDGLASVASQVGIDMFLAAVQRVVERLNKSRVGGGAL